VTERRLRVLCLVPYPRSNAAVRLRFEQQTEQLERLGVSLHLSSFLDATGYAVVFRNGHLLAKAYAVFRGFARRMRDAIRIARYDVLFVFRESAPFGPRVLEWLASACGVPVVYDFDEALFVPNIHPANQVWAWLRDPRRIGRCCRSASIVTTQNEYLAEYARGWNPRVEVLPTPVDTEQRSPRAARKDGPIVIGWVGSETTAPYLHLLDDVLSLVSSESGAILRVIGGHYVNLRVARLESREFDLSREQLDLEGFDIGILPEPDDPWTRGKGGYKALLYMAAGLPVVASRVGVNPEIVLDGETGYCVNTTEEWIDALRRLITDPELRKQFGAAGRARAIERYSITALAPRFAAAIRQASQTGSAPRGTRLTG
jgi:glycosyltransferase involved in cell wall biosynthesis